MKQRESLYLVYCILEHLILYHCFNSALRSVQTPEQLLSPCIPQDKGKLQRIVPGTDILSVGRGSIDLVWI